MNRPVQPLMEFISADLARHAKRDFGLLDSLAECTVWLNCILNERAQKGEISERTLIEAGMCVRVFRDRLMERSSKQHDDIHTKGG